MMIKYYTHQTPPGALPEAKSELPDLCRQSDYVSLPNLLERFIASGARFTQYMDAQALSAKEKEALFEQEDADDLIEEDISVQKAFVDDVINNVKAQQRVVKEPTQAQKEVAPETKPETAENA